MSPQKKEAAPAQQSSAPKPVAAAQKGPGQAAVGQAQAQRGYMEGLTRNESGAGAANSAQAKSTVPKPPAKMGSLEALGQYLGGFNVARGEFADVEVWVEVPLPQLPGAHGKFGLKGTYSCDAAGKKELSLAVDAGLSWDLFEMIKASVRLQVALKLTGEDLGAAFNDALKQNLLLQFKMTGIDGQVQDLARLAKEGAGFWDYAKALVPIYGTYEAAKIVIAKYGKDRVLEMHAAYGAFFHNNPKVGFESSVALVADGEIGHATKGRGALEARVGLEDVNNKEAKTFAEVAGEVMISNGNNFAKVRVSRRAQQGGEDIVKLELGGQYSASRGIAAEAGTRLGGMRAIWSAVTNLRTAVKGQKEGKSIPQISGVANALLAGFASMGVAGKNVDSMNGLEGSLTWTNGRLTGCAAKIKKMTQIGTGTGNSIGPVEANVQLGTFTDISKEFAAAAAAA